MTLKEKFLNSPCELGYINANIHRIENNEKIADNYAIDFARWIRLNAFEVIKGWMIEDKFYTDKELLEIFKKEKGL